MMLGYFFLILWKMDGNHILLIYLLIKALVSVSWAGCSFDIQSFVIPPLITLCIMSTVRMITLMQY